MFHENLKTLGRLVGNIRKSKRQTQAKAAYEAGVSLRSYQRIEAGEIVKTDGLLKVLEQFGVLEKVFTALELPKISPKEMLKRKGPRLPSALANKDKKVKIVWPEDKSS